MYVPDLIYKISTEEYFLIRQDLSPLRKEYLLEIEKYRSKINELTELGEDDKAFELLCEFYERVHLSFQTYYNIVKKLLRRFNIEKIQTILSGIKLIAKGYPEIVSYCDFLQFFSAFLIKMQKKKLILWVLIT